MEGRAGLGWGGSTTAGEAVGPWLLVGDRGGLLRTTCCCSEGGWLGMVGLGRSVTFGRAGTTGRGRGAGEWLAAVGAGAGVICGLRMGGSGAAEAIGGGETALSLSCSEDACRTRYSTYIRMQCMLHEWQLGRVIQFIHE